MVFILHLYSPFAGWTKNLIHKHNNYVKQTTEICRNWSACGLQHSTTSLLPSRGDKCAFALEQDLDLSTKSHLLKVSLRRDDKMFTVGKRDIRPTLTISSYNLSFSTASSPTQGSPIKIIRLFVLYAEVLISNSTQILNSEGGERETMHRKLLSENQKVRNIFWDTRIEAMIILKWIWKNYLVEVRTNATGCGLGTMEALVNSTVKHHIPQKKKHANPWIHLVYFTDFSYLFFQCNLNVFQSQGIQTVKKAHGK